MNLIEGKLVSHENGVYLEGGSLNILTNLPPTMADRTVLGAIRPEDVELSSTPSPKATLVGTVYSALPAGPETIVQVEVGNQRLTVLHEKTFDMKIGTQAHLLIPPEKFLFYDKETGRLISTTTITS